MILAKFLKIIKSTKFLVWKENLVITNYNLKKKLRQWENKFIEKK